MPLDGVKGVSTGRAARLAALRAEVERLERGLDRGLERGGAAAGDLQPLGLPALDAHLPGGGLPLGALHEISAGAWDLGAATAFCLCLLAPLMARRPGPLLWVAPGVRGEGGGLYGPGLKAQGVDPGRFLLVQAEQAAKGLWALENGLAPAAPGETPLAVVGELGDLPRHAGRRLQLAAARSGVTVFLLRQVRATAVLSATTRWSVAASAEQGGAPGLHVRLLRCRGAAPRSWRIAWPVAPEGAVSKDDAQERRDPGHGSVQPSHPFGLVAELCHRTSEDGASEDRQLAC